LRRLHLGLRAAGKRHFLGYRYLLTALRALATVSFLRSIATSLPPPTARTRHQRRPIQTAPSPSIVSLFAAPGVSGRWPLLPRYLHQPTPKRQTRHFLCSREHQVATPCLLCCDDALWKPSVVSFLSVSRVSFVAVVSDCGVEPIASSRFCGCLAGAVLSLPTVFLDPELLILIAPGWWRAQP
jgi:hypothetical protein